MFGNFKLDNREKKSVTIEKEKIREIRNENKRLKEGQFLYTRGTDRNRRIFSFILI